MSLTTGGAYLAKGALAKDPASPYVAIARFFAENVLPETRGLSDAIQFGADAVLTDPHGAVFA